MVVPLLDPARSNSPYQKELEQAALRVIRSGQYILGHEVESFEKSCAQYLGVKHAIGVSSGTDALLVSLMALNIGEGHEVICPSFTFFATAGSIARVGAKPVFVDICPDCFTLDVDDVRRAITSKTRAIIPVHLFGQSVDLGPLCELAGEQGLVIIEDAAQAIGAEYKHQKVGSFGIAGCFSFFPSKNLGGFGDAGLVATQDDGFAEKVRALRNHGAREAYIHRDVGGNFRIDALQAALLSVKLPYLDVQTHERAGHSAYYSQRLQNIDLYTLPGRVRGKHVWNQYTIRVGRGLRDKAMAYLKERGVGCAVYYPLPLHQQECFCKDLVLPPFLGETEKAAQECLSIPVASELSTQEGRFVADCLAEFARKHS